MFEIYWNIFNKICLLHTFEWRIKISYKCRNYGMDTESLKFIFISKRVVSLYQGLNQVR